MKKGQRVRQNAAAIMRHACCRLIDTPAKIPVDHRPGYARLNPSFTAETRVRFP